MSRLRVATIWLDGCSGCHMSLLDMDERLIELAGQIELVYSPLVDAKSFPEQVEVTLVEGAVGTSEDEAMIRHIREHTRILVALGDCAVTANVPAMRNPFGPEAALARAYQENATRNQGVPEREVPRLQARVRPVHEIVPVDVFVPGCPPAADVLFYVLQELIAGRMPDLAGKSRFGA
ncbi:MAG: NADP oxidoreductase [Bryobacteraceae bacterium]